MRIDRPNLCGRRLVPNIRQEPSAVLRNSKHGAQLRQPARIPLTACTDEGVARSKAGMPQMPTNVLAGHDRIRQRRRAAGDDLTDRVRGQDAEHHQGYERGDEKRLNGGRIQTSHACRQAARAGKAAERR
jgi:hypothetical protein